MFHTESLEELFRDVQESSIFADSKTFVDAIPKTNPAAILAQYRTEKPAKQHLLAFVQQHFDFPENPVQSFVSDTSRSVSEHVESLWAYLERQPNNTQIQSSLIPLPYPYIVPGGRFQEVYYWDSYFTMLGLAKSNKVELIENILNNFAYLIDTLGFIPNGNRTYYTGRSQPPFFSLMVGILADLKGNEVWQTYLNSIEKEHNFWVEQRTVILEDGEILNRYWDEHPSPRPEAYLEDLLTAQNNPETYRHLRAAAESGWDFSTRWFADEKSLATIHTTDIIPVDLNALLYGMEQRLASIYSAQNNIERAEFYTHKAEKRKAAIQKYCWNAESGFYFDYDFKAAKQKKVFSLAAAYPLFFGLANAEQAKCVATVLEHDFLQICGFSTTLNHSGQQWDAPNAWAPLQWICYSGLKNYGYNELAEKGKQNWLLNCETYYQETGKMMEKYNAFELGITAKGGEYTNQDGFGWTNGVYLAMKHG